MTARCGLFAIEQDLRERKARGEEEGRAFWEAMNTVYGRELGSWKSRWAADEEDDATEFDTGATWFDSDGFGEFEAAQREASEQRAEEHPLLLGAKVYWQTADRWHEQFGVSHRAEGQPTGRAAGDGVDVYDALEVTRWYCIQIQVKLSRALRCEPWEDEVDVLIAASAVDDPALSEEDFPSDADGSAKVALLGIERSFAAWSVLRDAIPESAQATLDLMRRLMQLRLAVDRRFPGARGFRRPGFDVA